MSINFPNGKSIRGGTWNPRTSLPVGVFLGFGIATVEAIVVGSEVLATGSIFFLGKDGFIAIKNKVVAAAKSSYTAPVGRTHHRIGIALLLTKVVTTYIMMIYAWENVAPS